MHSAGAWLAAVAALGIAACAGDDRRAVAATAADSTTATPDSIPEERPDSVSVTPPDSDVMTLSLLPPAPGGRLSGAAADVADRAVFIPRIQRWFMARRVDSTLVMDIGRIDGSVPGGALLDEVLAARSPVQPGMTFVAHPRSGTVTATVTGLRVGGRRILATLALSDATAPEAVLPVEWRGAPPAPAPAGTPAACEPGDTVAIASAIARYTPTDKDAVTVLRGCFGEFRALLTVRPLEITPESNERVVLVRRTGKTRSGRLRDLSYPLHALVGTTDIDADGTDEIVVHSFRPAMETWAALRMTDSVTFTRFASGFTIEKR